MDNHEGGEESHSLEEEWSEGLSGDGDPSGTLESQFCWRGSGRSGERRGEWRMEERMWVGEDVIGGRRVFGKWWERQSGEGGTQDGVKMIYSFPEHGKTGETFLEAWG